MTFPEFKRAQAQHVASMLKDADRLFVVDVDKDTLYAAYLESFPSEANQIFRERREHDCGNCRHYVKQFGAVVTLTNGVITTAWDFQTESAEYQPSVNALAKLVRSKPIANVFVSKESRFGVDHNVELDKKTGQTTTWTHLNVDLPSRLVWSNRSVSVDTEMAKHRDVKNVFKRSLDEIPISATQTVLELIAAKSLYKGDEHKGLLDTFLIAQRAYAKLDTVGKDLFAWERSIALGASVGKIRNHAIGTLLIDVAADLDLEEAVRKFEAVVAPSNYKRPQAIFTQRMLEEAKKKLEEQGLMPSLQRRYAVLDDVSVANVLFADRDASKRMIGGDVFDQMSASVAVVNPKSFDRLEEIGIETFIRDVLPTVQKVDVLLENRLVGNLVSLIAPGVKDSPSLFKWGNSFSWAYAGNITDSMKQRVKALGGRVDGVLRFSIQWNENGDNDNDMDAHAWEPNRNEISFMRMTSSSSGGNLDVDIRMPSREINNGIAVENITWPDLARMQEGNYLFAAHCYSHRGGRDGFRAEVEFDGQVFSFDYPTEVRQNQVVEVARVTFNRQTGFSITPILKSTAGGVHSVKAWGLDTNQFYPVTIAAYSPNYWDKQNGIGNKHYLFGLKGCVNDENPNGFFNEFLREDLLAQKRVFEALGAKMKVADVPDQISGLGFSSTQRNHLVVKVEGKTSRTLKVTF